MYAQVPIHIYFKYNLFSQHNDNYMDVFHDDCL